MTYMQSTCWSISCYYSFFIHYIDLPTIFTYFNIIYYTTFFSKNKVFLNNFLYKEKTHIVSLF